MTGVAEAKNGHHDAYELDVAPEVQVTRYAPGAQVRIRDEQWLVQKVSTTRRDG